MTELTILQFKELNPQSGDLFLKKYLEMNPYADTSHATLLYWWCLENDVKIALINDNVCIQSSYPSQDNSYSLSLFGDNKIDESLIQIFNYQATHNLSVGVHFVPEYTVDAITNKENYRLEENRDIAEYVMSIKEHALLEGSNFKRLRNKVSHFNKLPYISEFSLTVEKVTNKNADITKQAIKDINASQKNDRERIEDQAIEKLLDLRNSFSIYCYTLRHGTKTITVGLLKPIGPKTLNFCHIRYSSEYPDLFTYFFHLACKYIYENKKTFTEINIEQDLGIDGMRQHKLRMRPIHLLKKFSVYPIETTL